MAEAVIRSPFPAVSIPDVSLPEFVLGQASELGDHWRTLTEVRFSYLPNGATTIDSTGKATRTDTTVSDYTDGGHPIQWGGIVLERAYLEYAAHPLFNIRGGHWITPYGIWNVDHGSPVIIGVQRPYIIGDSLFPTSQTGIELFGTHNFSTFEIGYEGDVRHMRVDEIGDPWTPADVDGFLAPDLREVRWVHVPPLFRSDFPAETLAALARGRRILLDGQGLVRRPATGALVE